MGRAAARLRAWRFVWAVGEWGGGRSGEELVFEDRKGRADGRVPSAAGGAGGCGADYQWRSSSAGGAARKGSVRTAYADSVVSGSANGEGLSARDPDGDSGSDRAGIRPWARGVFSVGHRSDVLGSAQPGSWEAFAECGGMGDERRTGAACGRAGGGGGHGVGAEAVDDDSPCEFVESDDDEGAGSRDYSDWSAEGAGADSGGEEAGGGQAAGGGNAA